MALNRMLQKLHSLLNGRLLRRATAMALAASMVLPMTSAFAFTAQNKPTVLVTESDVKVEAPTINIELNAVVDAAGELTGELEIALWAKSGAVDGTLQPFNTLAVALQFSQALVPYDFSGKEVNLDNTEGFTVMTGMETLKKCNLLSTAGAMVSGIPAGEGGGGYLVLTASAHRPIELKEMTLLSVVTFKYDLASATTKPKATEVSAVNAWLAEQGKYLNENLNAPIKFAPAAVIDNADGAAVERELTYSSSTNLMYWSDSSYKQDEQEDSKYVPKLAIEAVDTKGTTDTSDDTLSKLSNLMEVSTRYISTDTKTPIIDEHAINFSLVNKITYDDSKMKNSVIIEFFDWDDTQIGALAVPFNKDAREVVNEYVKEHFIHPDLRDADVTSLTRVDTYRGKHPSVLLYFPLQDKGEYEGANGLSYMNSVLNEFRSFKTAHGLTTTIPADATDMNYEKIWELYNKLAVEVGAAPEGTKYYLNGKLDYVFFKRPMTETSANVWTQTDDGAATNAKGTWDTTYPYIHGWAVTDYQTPSTTWTTLGMGELSDYSGASFGGYQSIGNAPAELIVSGQTFKFADFDFATNPQKAGAVYAVKAVYEPGVELENSNSTYRVVDDEPYYIRLNRSAAAAGGSYAAEYIFERANVSVYTDHCLHGVARLRDPIVRQENTVDYWWLIYQGLDGEYPLATYNEAYTQKNQSVYNKITVANTDEIPVSLTLSARYYSTDFYIIEQYGGSNFTTGGTHTTNDGNRRWITPAGTRATETKREIPLTDATRSNPVSVVNNYNNYINGQSNENDLWYDAPYDERDGSLGFVLFATLNQIMQVATQYEDTDQTFINYVGEATLKDVNLRFAGGAIPNDAEDTTKNMRKMIRNAAVLAQNLHLAGNDKFWDTAHGYAQLTYHQLQGYILSGGTGTDPVNDLAKLDWDEGVITGLTWCHLHTGCVDAYSTKPTTWTALLDAARNHPEYIDDLTPNEAQRNFHLHLPNGMEYTVENFKNAVVTAVTALDDDGSAVYWDQVQDYILRGSSYDSSGAYSQGHYWWYDGATSATIGNFADLKKAARDDVTPVTLLDGSTPVTRSAKIDQLQSAFTANKTSVDAEGECDASWVTATENLARANGTTFANFSAFKTALENALSAAGATDPTWYQVQYHILHNAFVSAADAEAEGTADATKYWWHNGGFLLDTFAKLVRAARGGTLTADTFSVDDLYSTTNTAFQFRQDFAGTKYDNVGIFITAFQNYVTAETSGSETWERAQYFLIHGGLYSSNSRITTESGYYWWKNNGEIKAVDFSAALDNSKDPEDRANALAAALVDAAFRAQYNGGNAIAWKQLEDNFAAIMEGGRLVKDFAGGKDLDSAAAFANDFSLFSGDTDLATVKEKVTAMLPAQPADLTTSPYRPYVTYTVGDDTWHEIQYYFLNGYTAYSGSQIQKDNNYWWKFDDAPEAEKTEAEDYVTLVGLIKNVAAKTPGALAEFRDFFTAEKAKKLGFTTDGTNAPTADSQVLGIDWFNLDYGAADCGTGDSFNITWYQIELAIYYYATYNMSYLMSDAYAQMYAPYFSITAPSWYTTNFSYNYSPSGIIDAEQHNRLVVAAAAAGNATVILNGPATTAAMSADESDKDAYIAQLEAKVAEQEKTIANQQAIIDRQATYIVALESATPAEERVEQAVATGRLVSTVSTVKTWARNLVAKAQDTYTMLKERSRTNHWTRLGQFWAELLECARSGAATNITIQNSELTDLVVKAERRDAMMTTSLNNLMTDVKIHLSSRFSPGPSISLFDPGGGFVRSHRSVFLAEGRVSRYA